MRLPSKVFEYTDEDIAASFRAGDRIALDRLIRLPCIFMEEGTDDQLARVGTITHEEYGGAGGARRHDARRGGANVWRERARDWLLDETAREEGLRALKSGKRGRRPGRAEHVARHQIARGNHRAPEVSREPLFLLVMTGTSPYR